MIPEGIFWPSEEIFESYFACRNFQKGDRVKVFYKGKFLGGEVIGIDRKDFLPSLVTRTDKKINGKDFLYGSFYAKGGVFFEDESLPDGEKIYSKIVKRKMTPEEIGEANEPLPF